MSRETIVCRCCGKEVWHADRTPIHTGCISRHFGKHVYGINASKCVEMKGKRND